MPRQRQLMCDEIVEVMENHSEPFMTLGEIADQVDVTKGTVHRRIQEMVNAGDVRKKKVGAKAVIWWLPRRYQDSDPVEAD